jgi:hypothetical protein
MKKIALIAIMTLSSQAAVANPFSISYGGRITDSSGVPAAGPIDLEFKFFNAATGGSQVGPTKSIPNVPHYFECLQYG